MDDILDLQVAGRTARLRRGGSGAATVVVLHGAGGDGRAWERPAALLRSSGCSVLAPDLPGHGGSAGPALESVGEMARWLVALLDAAGVGACTLAGHSMGSLVALHAAAALPGRVDRLLLVATASPMRVSPRLLDLARTDPERAMAAIAAWSHDDDEASAAALTLERMRAAGAAAPGLLATDLAACDAAPEPPAGVAARTLLVLGRRDRMTPPRAALGLGQALGAGIDEVEAGHALLDDAPEHVAHAVLRLLAAG